MKKIIWIIFIALVMTALYGFIFRMDDIVAGLPNTDPSGQGQCFGYPNGVCESCTIGQCGGKDATPPDPNRPYFDAWGNKFTYNGQLISVGSCDPNTPSGANPYCPTPAPAIDQGFIGK